EREGGVEDADRVRRGVEALRVERQERQDDGQPEDVDEDDEEDGDEGPLHDIFQSTIPLFRVVGWHSGQNSASWPCTPAERILVPQRGQGSPCRPRTLTKSRSFSSSGGLRCWMRGGASPVTLTMASCSRSISAASSALTKVFGCRRASNRVSSA